MNEEDKKTEDEWERKEREGETIAEKMRGIKAGVGFLLLLMLTVFIFASFNVNHYLFFMMCFIVFGSFVYSSVMVYVEDKEKMISRLDYGRHWGRLKCKYFKNEQNFDGKYFRDLDLEEMLETYSPLKRIYNESLKEEVVADLQKEYFFDTRAYKILEERIDGKEKI